MNECSGLLITRQGKLTDVKTFDMMRDAMPESTLENIAAMSRSLGTSKTHLDGCLGLSVQYLGFGVSGLEILDFGLGIIFTIGSINGSEWTFEPYMLYSQARGLGARS
jgi:hypothetical protein